MIFTVRQCVYVMYVDSYRERHEEVATKHEVDLLMKYTKQ